jgi:hypothetical protein
LRALTAASIRFMVALSMTLSGCGDPYKDVRDKKVEATILRFFLSGQQSIVLNETGMGAPVKAFCIFEPYEDRAGDADENYIKINRFLDAIGFAGQEDYWALFVKIDNSFLLVWMNQKRTPLLTPKRPLKSGGSCGAGFPVLENFNSKIFVRN